MAQTISLLVFSWTLIMGFSSKRFQAHKIKNINTPILDEDGRQLNPMDVCWRKNLEWATNPQELADCAKGYGAEAQGGKNGASYVVADPSDDPVNPKKGTLRYGVIQKEPLWITFEKDMNITLGNELLVSSRKTIDGRGAQVMIGYGPCIRVENVSHVIIHGLTFENCQRGRGGLVRIAPEQVINRYGCDGDGISALQSTHVWIDHCKFCNCDDGLLDVTHASTMVTISNNYFSNHRKVMLLGHSDKFSMDEDMKVTVAFNYFGHRLVERMPRSRFGQFHVANNRYEKWLLYAIGGSSNPTILSEGNHFTAPDNANAKEATRRKIGRDPNWKNWSWTSKSDAFYNGAYFNASGKPWEPSYSETQTFDVAPAEVVPALTQDAGPLHCLRIKAC